MRLATGLVVAGFVCSAAFATEPGQRTLTFEDRVAAQKAIEQVYWNHRTWPKENPTPKPPLSAVMSDEAIRAKVEDYLKKSNALDTWWQRAISGEQLQAELDRMAKGSRDPQVLRELFAALDNDPFMIAETLVRQTLGDRLVHNWFASDSRFHGALKRRVEAALSACDNAACMKSMGGQYLETTWKRRSDGVENPAKDRGNGRTLILDADEWKARVDRLAHTFAASAGSPLTRKRSGLEETAEAFSVSALLSLSRDESTIASVVWPKESFDTWWGATRITLDASIATSTGAFHVTTPAAAGCTVDTWSPTNGWIEPRAKHTAVWTGTEMIVWGGTNDGLHGFNTGGRYNPSTDSWVATSTGPNVPTARQNHVAIWTGTEMIVWGGDSQYGPYPGGRYNPASDSWLPTATGPSEPEPRGNATAVWTGTEMIVWGGQGPNTGGRYNPSTDTWAATSTGANVPGARTAHTSVWTGTEMIIWGGTTNTNYGVPFDTGGRYNPSSDSWLPTATGANVPSARYFHTAVWTGTEMIVWGGTSGIYGVDTGARYNPSTDTWVTTSTGSSVPAGRKNHSAVWTGTEMIIWGADGSVPSPGGRYNPASDSWVATSMGANVPTQRTKHTAVWTGSEMIVWGGLLDSYYLNTGGRYNPSRDSWVPTSTESLVPTSRKYNTTVWTGSEMIVWGGAVAPQLVSPLNSGGRYNPSTDSWAATSTASNVPDARLSHTAVWTGTAMIVWGGSGSSAYLNTGGRYDPVTNSWAPMSIGLNIPSERQGHTAIWTGSEMIVWGGYVPSTYYNDGGRYRPATDSWTPTSTGASVPAPRSGHVAVWTGSEMIVWGGGNNTAPYDLNSGGRYSPSTDTWVATSSGANTPSTRHAYSAVWTGTEMIVWGGVNSAGSPFNTGGRYGPSTNSWEPTSTAPGVPTARSGHSAIWTGTEMVVWGGENYFGGIGNLNTGGRYNPSTALWTATSSGVNVPEAREGHTAIWTGTEMIVWGGGAPLQELSTGGLYCLVACASPTSCYRDSDGDGYGDSTVSVVACPPPAGYVLNDLDCNDSNPAVRPDALEVCNGIDDNCDGSVDEGGSSCNDGNACTAGDTCSGGTCQPGTTVVCNDNNICTTDSCNPASGCVYVANTAPCEDGNPCTSGDTCGNGVCNSGTTINCDDGNACTEDFCDSVNGCQHVNSTVACDDGNLCTLNDTCSGGLCRGGPLVVCNDFNPCTTDICNPAIGCVSTNNTAACDDGNPCTTGDTCGGGVCHSGTAINAPPETQGVQVAADKTTYSWSAATYATRYDVVRGSTGAFPVGPGGGDETCFDNLAGTTLSDPTVPALHSGFWYLSRGENVCGIGTFGTQGVHGAPGAPRVTTTCP